MESETAHYDVVVVGAGFAGLYALHRLRAQGFSVRVFERGSDVGGTWFWNRYPGARCDVPSVYYSYSFSDELQQEWEWTERFASQPEILAYLNHVADRFDLRRDISFATSVLSATYRDDTQDWLVETDAGERVSAPFFVPAVGCLSTSQIPEIPGLDEFNGTVVHSGLWPHEGVELAGKRVAVIGTGSSGIQIIPNVARLAGSLTVFQRTPHFSVPAQNRPLTPGELDEAKARYSEIRDECRHTPTGTIVYDSTGRPAAEFDADQQRAELETRWDFGSGAIVSTFSDTMIDPAANDVCAEYVRGRIREIVNDPDVARRLSPTSNPIGAKRICLDTDYYATYNRANVELVSLLDDPIETITASGVRTASGEREFDVLIFATGFDAMTGPLLRLNITGSGGRNLQEAWSAGPRTYLGVAINGFPNMFVVTGPGSPSVLSNMVTSIEQHVEWISELLEHLRANGLRRAEADLVAQDQWVEHVNEVASRTLMVRANSWYLGANIPGKPRVFMPYLGGVGNYRVRCEGIAAEGYKGFILTG
jgi:cyclohexanone monooxygenase